MKLTTTLPSTQSFKVVVSSTTMLVVLACASQQGVRRVTAPSDPEAAIHAFMQAVEANDLVTMGSLWGTAQGPAAANMDAEELQQRLTITRAYLAHEEYLVLQGDPARALSAGANERHFRVQLTRRGCNPEVPFGLVRWREGWLIRDIDLARAGNPARQCSPGSSGTPR